MREEKREEKSEGERKEENNVLFFCSPRGDETETFLPRLERKEEKTILFFCSPCDSSEVERNRGE